MLSPNVVISNSNKLSLGPKNVMQDESSRRLKMTLNLATQSTSSSDFSFEQKTCVNDLSALTSKQQQALDDGALIGPYGNQIMKIHFHADQ